MFYGEYRERENIQPSLSDIVFMNMQEGILVLDPCFHMVSINPWAQKVIGCNAECINGEPILSFFIKNRIITKCYQSFIKTIVGAERF